VAQWLGDYGDPRTGPIDMVDWIELIPVGETRNYVQRVTENVVMYRAVRHDPAPILANIRGRGDSFRSPASWSTTLSGSLTHTVSAWIVCLSTFVSGTTETACRPSCACPVWSAPVETSKPSPRRWSRPPDHCHRLRWTGQLRPLRDIDRYAPEACARDVMDICAALHIHHAVVIGTSFGGLLAMGLAAARPGLIRAVILNDVGPDVGTEGADFVRDFVGNDPALESLDACVTFLRAKLPSMSLDTDAAWRRMAELTYQPGSDGRFHPVWDTRIAQLLKRPPPICGRCLAPWQRPVLLIRGAVSNILLPATVTRMQDVHPGMTVVTLPGIGHAPILTEPPALAAIQTFLAQNA